MFKTTKQNSFIHKKVKIFKNYINNDPATILFSKKIIYIGNSIDYFSYEIIVSQILHFKLFRFKQDLNLFLNFSNDFNDNFEEMHTINLYCLLNIANMQISTVNLGLLKGIFSLLLLSASQRKRFGCYNSQIILHPYGKTIGMNQNSNELEKIWKYRSFSNNYLFLQYFMKTKLNIIQTYNLTDRNIFLNSKDSLNFGIIDKIII
ncbi:Clp protease (nucleomorph) [Lotharella oceanica]|uniref:ATP-dependent Clp protease proteolytic subunit n=1 Tax=Lotharella oceanica TaxID=641309 RepID=A0A060DGM3_9EUKA|nr:Clp protease [Lotharella oceanica]